MFNNSKAAGSQPAAKGSTPQNPWLSVDPHNELSWWNRFTDSLGFTNYAGRKENEYGLGAAQWQSEVDLAMADREYNSPEEQVARMRAAGLNPDLNGGQNVTSGQSEMANNEANQKSIEPIQQLDNVMSVFGKAIQFAASFLQSGVGLTLNTVNTLADLHTKDMSSMDSVIGGLKEELIEDYVGRINQSDRKDAFLKATGKEQQDILHEFMFNEDGEDNEFFGGLAHRTQGAFKTRRARQYAMDRLHEYFRNDKFRQDIESRLGSNASEKMATAKATSSLNALASTGDDLFDAMQSVAEAYYKEWKALNKLSTKRANNDYMVEFDRDTAAEAAGRNASFKTMSLEYKKNSIASSFQTEVMGDLLKKFKAGNKAAGALLFGFQALMSQSGGNVMSSAASSIFAKQPVVNKIFPKTF